MIYLQLFLEFFKVGLFAIGGGMATFPFLTDLADKTGWYTQQQLIDMVAIAESTPGPIAINAATYIGYKMLGIVGSLLATVAVCIPSFVIIYAISLFFDAFLSFTLVAHAFRGIQVCVIWLILSAGLKMLRQTEKTPLNIAILSAVIVCMVAFSLLSVSFSTIFYILISGCIGLSVYLVGLLRKRKEGDK